MRVNGEVDADHQRHGAGLEDAEYDLGDRDDPRDRGGLGAGDAPPRPEEGAHGPPDYVPGAAPRSRFAGSDGVVTKNALKSASSAGRGLRSRSNSPSRASNPRCHS